MINHFDTSFLQLACVRRLVCEIVGDKSDAMTKLTENLENLKHSERSRVLIWHGNVMVDHENVFPIRRRQLQGRQIAMCWSCHYLGSPFFRKRPAGHPLMCLRGG